MMTETRRIREGDCLADALRDLERTAREIQPWQADRWLAWVSACGDLLAAVPCELQRVAWAWSLAQAAGTVLVGLPHELMTRQLLARAEMVMRASGKGRVANGSDNWSGR